MKWLICWHVIPICKNYKKKLLTSVFVGITNVDILQVMRTRANKAAKQPAPRITFYQRVIVLAESVAKRPKSPKEKAEAEQVIELLRKAA